MATPIEPISQNAEGRTTCAQARALQSTATPRVSVIMPSFNTSRFISEAIDSVLGQTYPNTELIVIDDGSTDDTVAIIRSYGNRIRLIEQQNQGAAVARNAGLDAATGEFIAFLDSDDLWLADKLAIQVAYMQAHPSLGMIFTRWQVWQPDEAGRFTRPTVATPQENGTNQTPSPPAIPGIVAERSGWLYNRLLFSSLLHTITVMARKSLIDQIGRFDPQLKRGQDYDYWIRASRETEIHQLDQILALYRIHGNGCATKWPNENYEAIVVEKALAQWGLVGPNGEQTSAQAIRKRLADTSFSFGYYHFWDGSPRLARQAFLQCIKQAPTRLASWKYFVMSAIRTVLKRPQTASRTLPRPGRTP